ncbi:MAG: sulfatase-like hydrolase/transferase [Pirellulaceae bacterium]
MIRSCLAGSVFLFAASLPLVAEETQASRGRPNVLIIVADDLGYHDLGFQGSTEIPTPHLDRLAAVSVRCTSGYVSHPFCSPTRAGLLTGRYQHRFGHENNPAWLPESTVEGLPLDQITLSQLLQSVGYWTGAVGKWHLGAHPQFHPLRRGFDEYFGILGGGHQYFPGDRGGVEYTIPLNRNGQDEAQTAYLTDQFGEEAASFVKRHANAERPWFLYLAFNAPHTPLQAPADWLDKLASIADTNRRTYAAMVCSMDAAIGRVLGQLDATGQRDNTLVFFVSDNGGPDLRFRNLGNFTDNSPLRGAKGQVYEGGIRVPFLVSWPARLNAGVYDQPVSSLDFLPTAAAVARAVPPADRILDGVDLVPYLTGVRSGAPHARLFWRSLGPQGNHAVREGTWKFVRNRGGPPELYDLSTDLGETQNLAEQRPERVAHFTEVIAEWERGTIPPAFEGAGARKPSPKKASQKAAKKR